MINSSILFLTVTGSGIKALEKHGLGYSPQTDFNSVFVQPLKEVFNNVYVYNLWKRYAEIGVNKANQELINLALQLRPQYLLWPTMEYELKDTTIEAIRRGGVKTLGWFFDDEIRFDEYSRWWIPYLDICLTCDKESVSKYEKLGGRALHCLNRANHNVHKKMNLQIIYDVTFVGRKFGDRSEWMKRMTEGGINVQVFGSGWPNGHISTIEMVKIFNQSRINLNFVQSYGNQTRSQIKGRFFEVCLAGGFLLSESIPGIEEYFEIDKEIVCFKTLAEAEGKIKYYLLHENERQSIAKAGWMRAQRDHTTQGLFEMTFLQIEKLISPGDRLNNLPPPIVMPSHIRTLPSQYHYRWAKGLMIEGYPKQRWQEELDLALFYDPENKEARRLCVIGYFPVFVRSGLIYILIRLSSVVGKLKRALRSRALPVLRRIKQRFVSLMHCS